MSMTETLMYTQAGDYLLPNIRLSEPPREETPPLGRYGRMRKAFLKEHRKITYSRMLLSEELFPHLREVDELATARLEQVMKSLTAQTDLPDKAADQLKWAAAMNTLKAQAEEMVLNELIYAD
ncbi:hypothetical protein FACS189490_09850 [Clostridia bacterium]|nr:hypothetical protein FACS189490_09850 [Clostridia bacterium]